MGIYGVSTFFSFIILCLNSHLQKNDPLNSGRQFHASHIVAKFVYFHCILDKQTQRIHLYINFPRRSNWFILLVAFLDSGRHDCQCERSLRILKHVELFPLPSHSPGSITRTIVDGSHMEAVVRTKK